MTPALRSRGSEFLSQDSLEKDILCVESHVYRDAKIGMKPLNKFILDFAVSAKDLLQVILSQKVEIILVTV